jgi:2,6-dihydroxypyridine 3-monooxygenase
LTSPGNLTVGVVGGSLGGLTAALLLRDQGCEVDVFERSTLDRSGYGAGLGMHDMTLRYLVERAHVAVGDITVSTDVERFLDADGGVAHEYGRLTRMSTWGTLYRALMDVFGHDRFHADTPVESVAPRMASEGSVLTLADGSSRSFDLVVAADGIQSTLRQSLGAAVEFRSAGYVGWRGLVARSQLPEHTFDRFADGVTYFIGDHTHIVVYPVPDGLDAERGDEQWLNFVWYRNFSSPEQLDEILTDSGGTRREVSVPAGAVPRSQIERLRASAEAELCPPCAELVCATENPFVQLVGDLTVKRMVFGRTVLIGDAAFVARPHPAAGAAKACADAWALADAVEAAKESGTFDLEGWERERLAEDRRVIDLAVDQGERVQRHGSWKPGQAFWTADLFSRSAVAADASPHSADPDA